MSKSSKITDIEFIEPPIMDVGNGMVFIELNILSGRTNAKEIQRYQQDLKHYQREIERGESMAFTPDIDEPQEPEFDVNYRKQWWNIADKTIHTWYDDWDEERDCPIVIIDYSCNSDIDQLLIRSTAKEWMKLLESLGAIHIKP